MGTYEEVEYHHCKGNLGRDSTTSPTISPTTPSSESPPTSSSGGNNRCCLAGETRMKAYNDCNEFYHCVNGLVYPGAVAPGEPGLLLFDEEIQNWNYANLVTCSSIDDICTRRKNLRA